MQNLPIYGIYLTKNFDHQIPNIQVREILHERNLIMTFGR